jgi:glucose-1-phosphate adenylyltransferase
LRVEFSRRAAGETGPEPEQADSGLGDFGEHLLPALVDRGKVYTVDIGGYWRDVGRPEAYLAAHRDLLAGRVDVFDHPDRPVLTMATGRLPARVDSGAVVAN